MFGILILICFLGVLSLADGTTDSYYLRFTSPQQHSLILGTSRSAQGLVPSVISERLGQEVYNFSFTIMHSPYGPTYENAIKKKLDPDTKNGVFIMGVDPWSISSLGENPNNEEEFRELDKCLDNTYFMNMNPNFEYLIKNFNGKFYNVLFKGSGFRTLHSDGWLEVDIDMDSLIVKERIVKKVDMYIKNSSNYSFSTVRFKSMLHIIEMLKKHGKVFLVRLPVHNEIMKIENDFMPGFSDSIQKIAHLSDGFLDLTSLNKEMIYTDGNHLYKASAKKISSIISDWILEND